MRRFAIPDIHGRKDLLDRLLTKLNEEEALDLSQDKLIFLGDMIDRGADSFGVLNTIRKLTSEWPNNVIALAGNHEWLAIDACTRGNYQALWLWQVNGGTETLRSFGPECLATQSLPDDWVLWMSKLPLFHEEPGFFFSHAPVPDEEERNSRDRGQPFTRAELTWTYHSPEDRFARKFEDGRVGVCGHVHQLRNNVMAPRLYPHYIFADAGCGCSDKAPLVAIEVESRKVISVWPKAAPNKFEEPSL